MYKYVLNTIVTDVCPVFVILHHYTYGGGRFVDMLYYCLERVIIAAV